MHGTNNFKSIFTETKIFRASALIAALHTSLATSVPSHPRAFAVGEYNVRSDCPNDQVEGTLTISSRVDDNGEENEFLPAQSFTIVPAIEFGFPSNILISGRFSSKDYGDTTTSSSGNRECKALLWDDQANSGTFACYRGDELECTIHLEKI